MGAFAQEELGKALEGLSDPNEIRAFFLEIVDQARGQGNEIVTPLGLVKERGIIPIGIFGVDVRGPELWPHAIWYPWATPRQKFENTAALLTELNKHGYVMVRCKEKDQEFFYRLGGMALTRWVGRLKGYPGGNMCLFHGVKL